MRYHISNVVHKWLVDSLDVNLTYFLSFNSVTLPKAKYQYSVGHTDLLLARRRYNEMNGISNVNRGNYISDMKDRNYMQPVRLKIFNENIFEKPQTECISKKYSRFVRKTDGYQLAYRQTTTTRTL